MHMHLRKLGMMSICIPICRAMGTVIQSMEGNIAKKLQYLPERIKGMHVLGIDDTVVVDSGLPSDTFNTAYGGKVGDKTALDVMNYYQTKNYPMAWWIGPDTAKYPNHVSSLESAGFVHDEFDAGMFCRLDQMNAQDYQLPTDLKINFCTEPMHFNAFGNVLASIFDHWTVIRRIQDEIVVIVVIASVTSLVTIGIGLINVWDKHAIIGEI